jgi:dienelactone hydrolase
VPAGAGEISAEREKVRFASSGTECVAWHYPGTNGACVIMAGGFAVTKEPGTDLFARRFHDAGFAVLAFDYRHLGESPGQPRQIARIREQLADWQAAIGWAPTLPGVDPGRLAIWGFSVSGGHVFRAAARNPQLAAAIAQTPNAAGHYAAFLDAHELAVEAEVAFLRWHLLGQLGADHLLADDA